MRGPAPEEELITAWTNAFIVVHEELRKVAFVDSKTTFERALIVMRNIHAMLPGKPPSNSILRAFEGMRSCNPKEKTND